MDEKTDTSYLNTEFKLWRINNSSYERNYSDEKEFNPQKKKQKNQFRYFISFYKHSRMDGLQKQRQYKYLKHNSYMILIFEGPKK